MFIDMPCNLIKPSCFAHAGRERLGSSEKDTRLVHFDAAFCGSLTFSAMLFLLSGQEWLRSLAISLAHGDADGFCTWAKDNWTMQTCMTDVAKRGTDRQPLCCESMAPSSSRSDKGVEMAGIRVMSTKSDETWRGKNETRYLSVANLDGGLRCNDEFGSR